MDAKTIRFLIRYKLQSGRLPYDKASKVGGSPADGEICAACGTIVRNGQLVMRGLTGKRNRTTPIQFHVQCFELWNEERRLAPEQTA